MFTGSLIIETLTKQILFGEKMKTKLRFMMIILLLSILYTGFAQEIYPYDENVLFDINEPFTGGSPETGRDEIEDIQWVHNNEEEGLIPLDICYIPSANRLFVYGERRISIIDATTEEVISTIDASEYGHWKYFARTEEREKRIVYNPASDKVYCATDGMTLLVINPYTGIIENTVQPTLPDWYWWMILEVDELNNNILWTVSLVEDNYLCVVDCTTANVVHNEIIPDRIYDIKKHPVLNKFYIATGDGISVRQATSPYSEIEFHVTDESIGVIDILYNPENRLNSIVFCERDRSNNSNEEIYVLDETMNTFYSVDNLPYSFFSASCYSKEEEKLYLGYQQTSGTGILVLDESFQVLDNIIFDHNMDDPCDIVYNPNTRKVFCGSKYNMYVINEFNNVVLEHDYDNNDLYRLVVCKNLNKIFSTNYNGFSIESFSGDGIYLNSIIVGGRAFNSCYNEIEQKIYYYEKCFVDMDNVNIYIYDVETDIFDILNIGQAISDVKYNANNHLLYVSSYRTNSIRVFDVLNNHTELQPITVSHPQVHGIFITPNNKLFCATQNGIEIWNVTSNQYEGFISTSFYNRSNFSLNSSDNMIYISLQRKMYSNPGRVLSINYDTNTLLNTYIIPSPDKVIYDPINNKVFISQRNYGFLPCSFIAMNCDTYETETITTQDPVLYIELAANTGRLYVTPFAYEGEIYEFSSITNQLLQTFQTAAVASITKYNPCNNKLYVLVPYNFSQDLHTELWVIDCTTGEVTGMSLNQYEQYRRSLPVIRIDFTIDEESNKLYFGTGHSNLITIQCDNETERKTYTFPHSSWIPDCGWKWLSFDILYHEEDDNVAINFLAPISDIDELDHAKFKPHSPNSQELEISFFPPQHLDHIFTSPYGYKFHTITDCQFTVTGQRCLSETTFPLYGNNQENWVGYFLEDTQHIYDAFADQLDNLTGIRAQHWAIKNEGGWPDVPYTISPGDMVIAYCDDDVLEFTWNLVESCEQYTVPGSQDFTYKEEADYIPVFIELDPDDMPSEIGAYVDGECKGATVVQDTSAQICAYILENQGQNLEFEFSYGSRELNKKIKEYGIYEPEISKTEKGIIQIDNSRDCYYVSFKDDQNNTPVPAKIGITNFPNPFNPETTLFFSLPNEQEIELTIYNLKGQKVRELAKGQFPSGNNSVVWNGKDDNGKQVGSGLYLYKFKTHNKIISKKMLLLK